MHRPRRIVITGASRGIGEAIAYQLASPNQQLLLTARDSKALQAVSEACRAQGAQIELTSADLLSRSDVEQLKQKIAQFEPDILILNAGIARVQSVSELSEASWNDTLQVNLTAPVQLTQAALTTMKAGGSLVYISSVAGKTGFPNWSAYCASKFGLEGFTQAIREELRPRGIRVITINPAATDTDIWLGIDQSRPREKMLSPVAVAEAVALAVNLPPEALIDSLTIGATIGKVQ